MLFETYKVSMIVLNALLVSAGAGIIAWKLSDKDFVSSSYAVTLAIALSMVSIIGMRFI